jgi:hypothetical protein
MLLYHAGLSFEKEKTDNSRRERNNNKRNNYFYLGMLLIIIMRKYWLFGYHLEEVVWKQKHFSRK